MWAPINSAGHATVPSAEPKWVPYARPSNILTNLPPDGLSEPLRMQQMPNVALPTADDISDSETNRPIVRRLASAPLQYQESIPREHSNHHISSKQDVVKNKIRPNSSKNQHPPRIQATVSTVSWREELKQLESTVSRSFQQNVKSPQKDSNHPDQENHMPKHLAKRPTSSKDVTKVTKNSSSSARTNDIANGRGEQLNERNIPPSVTTRSSTEWSPKKTLISGAASVSSTTNPSQSKAEPKYEGIKAIMDIIAVANKTTNITRSHVDVTEKGIKDSMLQSKKRSVSENNLSAAHKHYQGTRRTTSLKPITSGGKMKTKLFKTQQSVQRSSPRKVDSLLSKKVVEEVTELPKEKQKGYDPKKAREYIKQQRCERLDRIREEKERKKADEEARKLKLSELNRTTHKLLQASIKKNPTQLSHSKPVSQTKTEDLKAPATTLVSKPSSTTFDAPLSKNHTETASASGNGLYIYPGPSHPVVSDATIKKNIIKDVDDMKATIDTLVTSLKNAIQLKAESLPQEPAKEKKRPPTIVDLHDNLELRFGENVQNEVKIQPRPLIIDKPLLIPETFDSSEVQHLTNNLRKMRENFRSVILAQEPPKREKRKPDKLRSTESEMIEANYAEKKRLQQWLHKLPASAQSAMEVPTLRRMLSGSSSEVDKIGLNDISRRPRRRRTKSSHQNSHQRFRPVSQYRDTSDDSVQENLSGGPLHVSSARYRSESDVASLPDWLKPLATEPYPVTFMSAVKRKLSQMASKKAENLAPPEVTLAVSSGTTTTQPTTSCWNHDKAVFIPPTAKSQAVTAQVGNSVIPSMTVTRSGQSREEERRGQLDPFNFANGFIPSSDLAGFFTRENATKPEVVERSQQTTPKETFDMPVFQDMDTALFNPPYSGVIINTAVPPLPRLGSTVTDVSSSLVSPDVLSSRASQISVVEDVRSVQDMELLEDQREPTYVSDLEDGPRQDKKSGEDTDAPSISSTVGDDHRSERAESENARLITPNVDLFSNQEEKSEWSSKRGCGDGEFRTQENAQETVQDQKDTMEIGRLYNPTALKLQFQAELNILDSFNESLCHVMEVEKVRAVTLARQQALLGTVRECDHHGQGDEPPPKSDKAVSAQKSLPVSITEISSINYTRGSATPPSFHKTLEDLDPAPLQLSHTETIQTESPEKDTNGVSTESPVSPVETSQPSSIPEKSVSSQSSGTTISEDIVSQEASVVRSHSSPREKSVKRLKLRQPADKISTESLSRGSKLASGDEVTDPSVASAVTEPPRTRDAVGNRVQNDKNERHPPVPGNREDAFQFTLQMLEQLMYEEELRVQHKRTLLKLRERVLCDMAKAECASLDLDKKKLRDIGGQEEQISALRKKQRGVLMKFQQQREEINAMQRTDELVWKERHLMYLRQLHLFRMQMSTRSLKNRRDEDGLVLPGSLSMRGAGEPVARIAGSRRDDDLGMSLDLTAMPSVSASSPSVGSDASIPSVNIPVNTSNGESESSCLDERPFVLSNKDVDTRSRSSRDKDSAHDHRQPVEQLNFWRRRLEEEERRLRDAERQVHTRHRPLHLKHSLRDRSTSPFQFPESVGSNFARNSGNSSKQRIPRPVSNGSGSGSVAEEDKSIPEDIVDPDDSKMSSVKEATSAAAVSEGYTNESFESIESEVKTVDTQSVSGHMSDIHTQSNASNESSVKKPPSSSSERSGELSSKQPLRNEKPPSNEKSHTQPSVTIKVPLSPRIQRGQRRRYSSGSDDSIVFSQTETGSEQSDIEGRISALTEQLQQRKAEAERLRKEAKRTRCERLLAKEQSLLKQLQAYDVYISQARQNLDAELKQTNVPIVRPQIKQPRVASAGKVKTPKTSLPSEQDVSIQDSVVESSASQDSSLDAAVLSPSKQNAADLEFMLPEPSATKDVISDAMSTVASELASGDISEVSSENGSSESNEIASLVTNMGGKDEVIVKTAVGDVEAETLSNVGSDATSEVATDVLSEMDSLVGPEIIEDTLKKVEVTKEEVSDPSKHSEESNEASSAPSPFQSEKADASDSSDVDDLIEVGADASFIKVVFKEKGKEEDQKTSTSPVPESLTSTQDQHSELVDRITDSILENLLNDCLGKAVKAPSLASTSINESKDKHTLQSPAQTGSLSQNNAEKKSSTQQEKKTKEVLARVNELLAETVQSPTSKTESRLQDLMVTTYDILSPDESPISSPHQGSPTRQGPDTLAKVIESDNGMLSENKTVEAAAAMLAGGEYSLSAGAYILSDSSIQDWVYEDSETSERDPENLRLEEMEIQQRIEELDQVFVQIPFFLREIPNKPPPPYTPPGQAPRVLATSVPSSPPLEEIRAVTKDQNEIIHAVSTATDMLYEAYCRSEDLETILPPESFLMEGYSVPEHVKLCEQDLLIHKNSARVYRRFLFDLSRQIVQEAFSHEQEDDCPPWLVQENAFSKRKALAEAPRSKQDLQKAVSRRALLLFGFGPKAEKENLTIRWSRKKRDHVDELLVRELQEEERQWTSYEYDEAIVKNKVTESILEGLLAETLEDLNRVFQKALERRTARLDRN